MKHFFLLFFAFTKIGFLYANTINTSIDEISKYELKIEIENDEIEINIIDKDQKNWTGNVKATQSIFSGLLFTQQQVQIQKKIINKSIFLKKSNTPIDVYIFQRHVGRIVFLQSGNIKWLPSGKLTSFDIRMLGKSGPAYAQKMAPTLSKQEIKKYRSPVDLHTHFGGALRSEEIMRIAFNFSIPYPTALLDELKISYPDQYKNQKAIPITHENISEDGLKKLIDVMDLPKTEVVSLERMEVSYKFRGPLVKFRPAFQEYLRSLAIDYKQNGVEYALLSLSDVSWPDWLGEAHEILPKLEQELGVKIRFLVALWRHSPTLFNQDIFARTKALLTSPYIVGFDFMGHETNSSHAIENEVRDAKLILEEAGLKEGIIRVHAGENLFYPSNVKNAVQFGSNQIGHGLYGVDQATLNELVKTGSSVEINTGSNLALNNAVNAEDIPIRDYLAHKVPVTLGTDGHGLYGETPASQLYGAIYAGATKNDLSDIHQFSKKYINRRETEFKSRLAKNPNLLIPTNLPEAKFKNSDWTIEENRKQQMKINIEARLKSMGYRAHQSFEAFLPTVPGMKPILITGASMFSYEQVSLRDRETILKSIREMIHALDPAKVYFVTGGSDYGVEKIVHQEIERYNQDLKKQGKPQFKMLGTLVSENRGTLYELGPITDAIVAAPWWFERSATTLKFVANQNGLVIYWSGGAIVADEIQSARNSNVKFALAKGPAGAANNATSLYPEKSFADSNQLIQMISSQLPEAMKTHNGSKNWKDRQKFHWLDKESAIKAISSYNKKVVTFAGFSRQGYKDHQAFHDAIVHELNQLDSKKYIINAGGSSVGIGYVYEVAKKMGFQTIGTVSEKAGDPASQSRYADEIFVIKDNLYGGYDPKTGQRSTTTETFLAISDKLVAMAGGQITGMEIEMFQKAGKKIIFYDFQSDPQLSVASFIKSLRSKVQKRLHGRDKEFSDGSVDIALQVLGTAQYNNKPIDSAVIALGEKRIAEETAGMYDIGGIQEFSKRIMAAAKDEFDTLDEKTKDAFFLNHGFARTKVPENQRINYTNHHGSNSCIKVFKK